MGGLIALSLLNKRPELIKGIVFCGTPFGPVPLILWGMQKNTPFSHLFSPEMHFISRSSFLFLPRDGRALVNDKDDVDFLVDFYDADEWIDYKLSHVFNKHHQTNESMEQRKTYLKESLELAKKFQNSLAYDPNISYPPLCVLLSEKWPTPSRIKCSLKQKTLRILHPCHFTAGDGIVTFESALMPLGFQYDIIRTKHNHVSMMNDLNSMKRALQTIINSSKNKLYL